MVADAPSSARGAMASSGTRVKTLAAILVVLAVSHDLDHIRQQRPLGLALWSVSVLGLVASVTVLAVAMRGSRFTGSVAAAVGAGTIVGLAAVHAAPTWWVLSDSYGDAGADVLSWAIIIAMMSVAGALAIAGLRFGRGR